MQLLYGSWGSPWASLVRVFAAVSVLMAYHPYKRPGPLLGWPWK